jgi:hypothetical protein
VICGDVAYAALVVHLEDAATGATVPFTGITAIAVDGAYRDSSTVRDISSSGTSAKAIGLAFGRAGTYTVQVSALGYKQWSTSGVVVERDAQCGQPIPRTITATLQPQ